MVTFVNCCNLSEIPDFSFPFWVGMLILVDSDGQWFSIELKFSDSLNLSKW